MGLSSRSSPSVLASLRTGWWLGSSLLRLVQSVRAQVAPSRPFPRTPYNLLLPAAGLAVVVECLPTDPADLGATVSAAADGRGHTQPSKPHLRRDHTQPSKPHLRRDQLSHAHGPAWDWPWHLELLPQSERLDYPLSHHLYRASRGNRAQLLSSQYSAAYRSCSQSRCKLGARQPASRAWSCCTCCARRVASAGRSNTSPPAARTSSSA
jgi:hypothetical protein